MLTKLLCALVASLALIAPVSAQAPQGDWQGALKLPDRQLRVIIQLRKAGSGFAGFMASPDQGGSDIPIGAIKSDEKTLAFVVPSIKGAYRGTWDGSREQWTGEWTQGKSRLELNLSRATGPVPPPRSAVALAGDWDGVLDAGSMRLRVVLHVQVTKTGTFTTFDSVDQAANGIPVSSIRQDDAKVRFELRAIGAEFEGMLDPGGQSITGRWLQAGQSLPLTLTRRAPGARGPVLSRPQMPQRPFPYREEEVSYTNAGAKVRLAGTLTLPQGRGPFPAVVLIAGSGPLDRDESLFGHKPFLVLADHLTRQGLAVLRVDKRGIGKSTGDHAAATTADFASDLEAGLAFLRSRADIDSRKIGLVGHSEGGMIAPLVAARDPNLAFIVLLAGPGVPGSEILLDQIVDSIVQVKKLDEDRVERFTVLMRKALAAAAAAATTAEATEQARKLLRPERDVHGLSDEEIDRAIGSWNSNWSRYFLAYDPSVALRKTRSPVLALNGSLDVQVRPKENLAGIRRGLAENPTAELHELPGLNHLFQTAKTGRVTEYATIEETIAPSVLDLISKWILARVRSA